MSLLLRVSLFKNKLLWIAAINNFQSSEEVDSNSHFFYREDSALFLMILQSFKAIYPVVDIHYYFLNIEKLISSSSYLFCF